MKKRLGPAAYAIRIFGGTRVLARAIDRDPSSVSKWQLPPCNGRVPRKAQEKILELAKINGMDITPDDLINGRVINE